MATTQETLELLKTAQAAPNDALTKAFTQSSTATSGLTAYDLEAPAKTLYPVITPLRNEIPRIVGGMGIQANWRAITAINTGNAGAGISEGNRGVVQSTTVTDYTAAFKGLGLEDYVTFEADYAGQGFDDVKARAVQGLLRSLMISEEKCILGGNTSIALGTASTPSCTASNTGGTLASNQSVIVVALTLDGYQAATVAGGLPLSATRTLADGTTEAYNQGTSIKSAANAVTISGSTASIAASTTVKNGAVAYAWFWGAANNEILGAITTANTYTITAAATGTQAAASNFTADKSRNSLVFDGLLSQIMTSGSGAYVKNMANGTTLTADNKGGITEIDVALQSFWDNYKLSPDTIWVNAQQALDINTKVLAGSTAGAQRFVFNSEQSMLAGGSVVVAYLNKFALGGAQSIPIKIHPYMPAGTILFTSKGVPYPLSNVGNVLQMKLRRDYYQIEYPLRTRKYEYGVYMDGVLQCYFPPAFGIINNITAG